MQVPHLGCLSWYDAGPPFCSVLYYLVAQAGCMFPCRDVVSDMMQDPLLEGIPKQDAGPYAGMCTLVGFTFPLCCVFPGRMQILLLWCIP